MQADAPLCAICQAELPQPPKARLTTSCGHTFCFLCLALDTYYRFPDRNAQCPVCRREWTSCRSSKGRTLSVAQCRRAGSYRTPGTHINPIDLSYLAATPSLNPGPAPATTLPAAPAPLPLPPPPQAQLPPPDENNDNNAEEGEQEQEEAAQEKDEEEKKEEEKDEEEKKEEEKKEEEKDEEEKKEEEKDEEEKKEEEKDEEEKKEEEKDEEEKKEEEKDEEEKKEEEEEKEKICPGCPGRGPHQAGWVTCAICQKCFRTDRGMRIHRGLMHRGAGKLP
jgi:hypothetical protein